VPVGQGPIEPGACLTATSPDCVSFLNTGNGLIVLGSFPAVVPTGAVAVIGFPTVSASAALLGPQLLACPPATGTNRWVCDNNVNQPGVFPQVGGTAVVTFQGVTPPGLPTPVATRVVTPVPTPVPTAGSSASRSLLVLPALPGPPPLIPPPLLPPAMPLLPALPPLMDAGAWPGGSDAVRPAAPEIPMIPEAPTLLLLGLGLGLAALRWRRP
jgi:hypothetical protein